MEMHGTGLKSGAMQSEGENVDDISDYRAREAAKVQLDKVLPRMFPFPIWPLS